MPTHQGIGRDYRIKFQQRLTPHRLSLSSQQRAFRICEPNALAAKSLLQHPIPGLKELDDDH